MTASGSGDWPQGYTGKWQDETGLVYFGFRYYVPEVGRWLSEDPIGEEGGVNLYGYVGGIVTSRIDVLGLVDLSYEDPTTPLGKWEPSYHPKEYFTVTGHTFENNGFITNNANNGYLPGQRVYPKQIAEDMVKKGYDGTKPVLFIVCDSVGGNFRPMAQDVANELAKHFNKKIEVLAPTTGIGPKMKTLPNPKDSTKPIKVPIMGAELQLQEGGRLKKLIGEP